MRWLRFATRGFLPAAAASAASLCAAAAAPPKPQVWPSMAKTDGPVVHRADGSLDVVGGNFNYQEKGVELVWTKRDTSGSDDTLHGARWNQQDCLVKNGRGAPLTLWRSGFEMRPDPKKKHVDYYSEAEIVSAYYPECETLLREAVGGAARVVAFDHNVRCVEGRDEGRRLNGGNAVQGPASLVHGDYTAVSAPRRLKLLGDAPKVNDVLQGSSVLPAEEVASALAGNRRWAFINVWRPISTKPVQEKPLACCDAASVSDESLLTFQIHYADRIGENYFAIHEAAHDWYYFPQMTRDEVLLLLQWDSEGDFARAAQKGTKAKSEAASPRGGRATFSLHSAFADPSSPPDAPSRESIEVRCVVIF